MNVYVCSKCGAEGSISRLVTLDAWESVEVEVTDEGDPKDVTTGEREADWGSAGRYSFHCCECDQRKATLKEAVRLKHDLECRTCGWVGDQPEEHPEECYGEVLGGPPPEVHPDQQSLVPA